MTDSEREAPGRIRVLSPMESAVMGWVEAERLNEISGDDVASMFPWRRDAIDDVLDSLSGKGRLRRTARGRYEIVLAETAGLQPPSPWAALSTWSPMHYVGYQSAAHELGLSPDRPGDVQVVIAPGTSRPLAWAEMPIELITMRRFSLEETKVMELHEWNVRIATAERIVADCALLPDRAGGIRGLARIVDRVGDEIDWGEVVRLIEQQARGSAEMRRLAALLELIAEVPAPLAERADPGSKRVRRILLGGEETEGSEGRLLERWSVIANIDPDDLREELRR